MWTGKTIKSIDFYALNNTTAPAMKCTINQHSTQANIRCENWKISSNYCIILPFFFVFFSCCAKWNNEIAVEWHSVIFTDNLSSIFIEWNMHRCHVTLCDSIGSSINLYRFYNSQCGHERLIREWTVSVAKEKWESFSSRPIFFVFP